MIKNKSKRKTETTEDPPKKKIKKTENNVTTLEKPTKSNKIKPNKDKNTDNPSKTTKTTNNFPKNNKSDGKPKFKSFGRDRKPNSKTEKPADWNEFKKKKKEVQDKRKQNRTFYDVIVQAKKIGEDLRRKTLKDGPEERKRMTEELHKLLGGQNNYAKFVLSHDMARIVQYMLKFSPEQIRREIATELIPSTVEMIQSKYAKFCVKHMLKYGDSKTRSEVMRACYGHAVKLTSHAVSAPVFEYGYTTWASTQEKRHLVQEFYGDMYKQSKDDSLTHVRDIYKASQDMKTAVLGAIKGNLSRIMNKELLDSHLVQTVISQYLDECNAEDRAEIISQLTSHIVVLSNSKEGAHAAMICFWYGTNKDRKVMLKTIKEHIINMCKHEHAHNTIIGILDSVDDTVLVNKTLLGDILSSSEDLLNDEWGKKILLWLVAPGEKAYFHPTFLKELDDGREKCTSKKNVESRREEILKYCIGPLLEKVGENTAVWFKSAAVAVVAFAILRAGSDSKAEQTEKAYMKITEIITDSHWKITENDKETIGVEDAGFHMIFKKLLQHEKTVDKPKFAEALVNSLSEKTISKWIKSDSGCNRACFLLIHIIENCSEDVKNNLIIKISKKIRSMLEEKQKKVKGASILLKKLT